MDFTTAWQGRVLVGTMKGELGIRDHEAMSRAIAEMVKSDASGIVLNFAEVVYLASVGIGMLLKLVKEVQAKGVSVRMAAPRPAVKMVLEMVKAESVLPMDPTLEEALERVVLPVAA
jgi:anti-sigma B factor antagonist